MSTPPMMGQQPGQAPVFGGGEPLPPPSPDAFAEVPQVPQGMQPQQPPMAMEPPPVQDKLRAMLTEINIAEKLDEDELTKIGTNCLRGFNDDLNSRTRWEHDIDQWTKLAIQTVEQKSFPWQNASNVKYPLLATASMQFAARAYPALVPSDGKIVKTQVIGKDPDGQKAAKAARVSTFMSWQIMHEMEGWEEEMDKLMIMLPIIGTMFKKTWWDSSEEKNCSKIVYPKNLVVNYWTRSLQESERVSEMIEMSPRVVKEKQLAGIYLDVDLGTAPTPMTMTDYVRSGMDMPSSDSTTPYTIIEQHGYIDLDEDGYEEPYIITFHKESGKVLRISPRFDEEGITTTPKGKIQKIKPINYYTKFGFIPNPDGSFYDIGFGCLLGPINESVNTLINQLIDAGTLNNLQGGFIGKGLRLKMGEQRFSPGEWKAVNATGDDLRKQIVPIPAKEPSGILFQLMGALITSGKELASVAEIFVGKMPGQNTPATTTMASIDQGMKVFTAVYKRLYRSLAQEFQKLFNLNRYYLDPQTEVAVLDEPVNPGDFDGDGYDLFPGADPSAISAQDKMAKAQQLMQMLPSGLLDPMKVIQAVLEASEIPNWQSYISQGAGQPKGPSPQEQEMQMKAQADQQAAQLKQQQMQMKMQFDQQDHQTQMAMKSQQANLDAQLKLQRAQVDAEADRHYTQAKIQALRLKNVDKAVDIRHKANNPPSRGKK